MYKRDTSTFSGRVGSHKDLKSSRIGHTIEELGQIGFRQQTFLIAQHLQETHTHTTKIKNSNLLLNYCHIYCVNILSFPKKITTATFHEH